MDRNDEHKRVKEDQEQGKGKAKIAPSNRRDFRSERYNNNQPMRDFVGHTGHPSAEVVSAVFKEPIH